MIGTQSSRTLGELAQAYIDTKRNPIEPNGPLSTVFTYAHNNLPRFIKAYEPIVPWRKPDERGMSYSFEFARNKTFDFESFTDIITALTAQENINTPMVMLDATSKQGDRQKLSLAIRKKEDREKFELFIKGLTVLLQTATQDHVTSYEHTPGF